VLRDIDAQGGADEYWALGDLAAIGYDPVGVLERLCALPGLRALRGNTERYVLTGDRPPPTEEDMLRDPHLLPTFVSVARSFAWTGGYLAATGWIGWLESLPTQLRASRPDGTQLLAVHSTPQTDGGRGLLDRMTDAELLRAIDGCGGANLVLAGYTHRPFVRVIGSIRVANLGSVSNPHPVTQDRRASYVMLHADHDGYQLEHRRIAYDYQAVIGAIKQSNHPSAESF
jgi:hypothetical protein